MDHVNEESEDATYSGDVNSQTPSDDSLDRYCDKDQRSSSDSDNMQQESPAKPDEKHPPTPHIFNTPRKPPPKKQNTKGSPMDMHDTHTGLIPLTSPDPRPSRFLLPPPPSAPRSFRSTGTAPTRPSSLAESSRALDFEGLQQTHSPTVPAAPDPVEGSPLHQE